MDIIIKDVQEQIIEEKIQDRKIVVFKCSWGEIATYQVYVEYLETRI